MCQKRKRKITNLRVWETLFYPFRCDMPATFPDFETVTEKRRWSTPRETPEIGILNRSKSSLSPKDSRRNSPSESTISPHTGRRVNVTTIGSLSFLHYETAASTFVRRAISRDRDSILRLANHTGKSVDRWGRGGAIVYFRVSPHLVPVSRIGFA